MVRKLKNIYHLLQAQLATSLNKHPGKEIFVIGVTGTDGKTTTTSLIYHILSEARKKVAMITTVGAKIGETTYDTGFHTTTPSSFTLQKYIKNAAENGYEYLVLEVTSHGLDQNRAYGIPFQIGVVTNITHEHLDYHKTYENYVRAKQKLLERSNICVLNMDDASYPPLQKNLQNKEILTYSLTDTLATYTPSKFPFSSSLVGEFNKQNILAAITVCKKLGIADDVIRNALTSFKPPIGRQEIVHEDDFIVMVDFAHTPNAFEKVLPEAKKLTKGRFIHVFGSAGQRDKTKRPLMGKASASYADIIILTAEDPRNESINAINKDIMEGINEPFILTSPKDFVNTEIKKRVLLEIDNRKKAIEFAVAIAQKGDLVLLTGKGHEQSINYGHGEELWDESEIAKEAIKKTQYQK